MAKVHPLGFHIRGRSPKNVASKRAEVTTLLESYGAKSSTSRAKFGSSKMLDPNFRREAKLFLEADYFSILFQPKSFSSRHSLVWKSDASPLSWALCEPALITDVWMWSKFCFLQSPFVSLVHFKWGLFQLMFWSKLHIWFTLKPPSF